MEILSDEQVEKWCTQIQEEDAKEAATSKTASRSRAQTSE